MITPYNRLLSGIIKTDEELHEVEALGGDLERYKQLRREGHSHVTARYTSVYGRKQYEPGEIEAAFQQVSKKWERLAITRNKFGYNKLTPSSSDA